MEAIDKLCTEHLGVQLLEMQLRRQNKYHSQKRHLLVGLLSNRFKWNSDKVAKLLNRTASAIRYMKRTHNNLIDVDKEYFNEYNALLSVSNEFNIPLGTTKYKNNFNPIKLKHIKTGEVYNFKSKSAAARHLKCSVTLINYYLDKKITQIFDYLIIN